LSTRAQLVVTQLLNGFYQHRAQTTQLAHQHFKQSQTLDYLVQGLKVTFSVLEFIMLQFNKCKLMAPGSIR
jgi:hypothetical protein